MCTQKAFISEPIAGDDDGREAPSADLFTLEKRANLIWQRRARISPGEILSGLKDSRAEQKGLAD